MRNRILLTDRQRTHRIDETRICDAAATIAAAIWDGPVEVSITLLGRRAMAAANRTYRGFQGATDQISFPMTPIEGDGGPSTHGMVLVGDLLLSPAVISAQCHLPPPAGRPRTGTPDSELALVLCHGLLHLQGHTHVGEDDGADMVREESRLFEAHSALLDGAFLD